MYGSAFGMLKYFNPHSRKGSDNARTSGDHIFGISIHTPARGVTLYVHVNADNDTISIHTPARGVTHLTKNGRSYLFNFNPHSRKGSDCTACWNRDITRISIHTPARGVTERNGSPFSSQVFQSTLPQGE